MLPAGLRGFASRVGRLALRAFAWNKGGADSCAAASAAASATSESIAAATASTAACTAHPSHTLRRALLAMLVAAATLLAMLVLPPVNKANAGGSANVLWDYNGIGYVSPSSVDAYDVTRDVDVKNPVFTNKNGKTIVTWEVLFNKDACRVKLIDNPSLMCDPKEGSHSYEGRPDFFVVLPSDVKDETVRITRYRTKLGKIDPKVKHFVWGIRGKENGTPYENFKKGTASWTNDTRVPGDPEYDKLWNDRIARCGVYSNDACEAWNWKNQGKFGRLFKSWEQSNTVDGIRWVISAEVKDGVDPYNMPFMAGFVSYGNKSDKNKFIIWGPYDHDGDGIPDSKEWFYGFNPQSNDDVQFPDKSEKDGVYGEITDVNPYFKRGEWNGYATSGHFVYDGTKLPFEQTNAGITFSFKKGADGKEILPSGVTKANSPNNMQPGQAYIDPITGKLKYNPKKTDKGHTIHFDVQITYPNPGKNSCKYKQQVEHVKGVNIHVVSQASLYNPYYDDTTVKAGEEKNSPNPKDRGGKKFPSGTKFKAETYDNHQNPPTWAKIKDESTGVVTFHPNKWVPASKAGQPEKRPVVVYYPDDSTSKDKDSGNKGKPVNAQVYVTRDNPGNADLQLHIHKNQNGSEINYGDGFVFRKTHDVSPQPWIDSWSKNEPGDITIRSVCADITKPTSPKFYLDGINGIKINGERPWPHATDEEQEKCRNGKGCVANKLFDSTGGTMERTRGSITGNPPKTGNYQCTVYALKPKALAKFKEVEKRHKDIVSEGGSSTNIIESDTFKGLKDGIDYTSRTVPIKVHSDAYYYNPQYTKVSVKAGHKGGVTSAAPVSQRGANGVGSDNSQNDLVADGTRLPKGTWFELKKYSKHTDSKDKLSWSSFEGKQSNKKSGEDKPEDTTSEEMYGKVTFAPDRGIFTGKYNTPVIVHYPDGSTSEDPDSGNLGKPVYAPVSVTDQDIQDDDLKLRVHSQYGGRQIGDNDRTGIRFRPGEVLGNGKDNTKPMFFDSWSSAKPGKIYQRMLCYKLGADNKRSDYTIDGVNGLTLAGREGNTLDGKFTNKPSQWTRANNEQRNECKADGSKCNHNLYLYGDEHDTTERTWGWLRGKVNNNGDYVCTVYAIKDLENKDGNHGNLQKKFDKAVKEFVKSPGDRKFEDVISKSVLKNQKGSKNNPIDATQRHVDWDSVTFPIHVHNDAHYYNPQYTPLTMEAGTKQATALPTSAKDANGADKLQDDVHKGDLPDGTWFKFKKSLSYTFFEDDQDNKADSGDSAKNPTGKFGKVTFRPNKWFPAATDKVQVIVYYPDGSTSEEVDSGNNGKPIYANVNVTRTYDEDANNLRLNIADREGRPDWHDTTINLSKDEELSTDNRTTRWLDSWSEYKPGQINLRTICHRVNPDGTNSNYQSGGIAGIKMQDVKMWKHTEKAADQKACEKDARQCKTDTQLYDNYITNGNSRDTTERTRGWIKGTAKETGDYECVVYAIKSPYKWIKSDLLTRFDAAVNKLGKDASKNNTDPLSGFKWNLDGDTGKTAAVKGVDYAKRTIPIHIHTQAHNYNPVYDKVSVQAGKEVQSGLPKNKKPTGDQVKTDSLAYKAIADGEAFPKGTWFELKKEASSPANYANAYDWSFWKNGQKDSNAPNDQSNPLSQDPNTPLNHSGKDTGLDSGSKYGKVTFQPDVTVDPKDYYQTHVVVHYPDGSNSDNPDAGNNQFKASSSATSTMNPVFAKVQVTDLGYKGHNDLRMVLTKAKDTDSVLDSKTSLTVMRGIGLLKNPFVQAWSVKDKGKINLRMMCTKSNEQKWSRGLESTLNMHLGNDYGNSTPAWNFATEEQQKDCRENGVCNVEHVLYGFLNDNTQPGSVESAVARREEEIEGAPKETGTYSCSVFALKDKALGAFDAAVRENIPKNDGSYTSTDMWNVDLKTKDSNLKKSQDWDRISFKVNVVEPFKLPKTGGEDCVNWNMLMSVVCVLGTGAMAAGFFLDQTKWGRAMLEALLRKAMLRKAARGGVAADCTARTTAARTTAARTTAASTAPASLAAAANRAVGAAACDHAEPATAIKSFIRKTAERCGGVMLRIEWWITERWRC